MRPLPSDSETIGWLSAPAGWTPRVLAGISTRRGGVSQDWLAQANYSLRVADDPLRVAENLRRLAVASGVPLERAAGLRLEHGARVHVVGGSLEERARAIARLPGDGLVTAVAGLPLTLTVADCLPLFASAEGRAVVLAHCGWRGIAAGIVRAAVEALARVSGIVPGCIDAWIGPGIGPCCYTLGSADADLLSRREAPPAPARALPPQARLAALPGGQESIRVDLPGCVEADLIACGVVRRNIHRSAHCTACREDLFYSHRRDEGRTGRMLAWIMIEE